MIGWVFSYNLFSTFYFPSQEKKERERERKRKKKGAPISIALCFFFFIYWNYCVLCIESATGQQQA